MDLYNHPVLEAKLVTPIGFASLSVHTVSPMTEFIENPGENPKQDCELKAFYRLAKRLKRRFPRLPIYLLLDGLFAGGPTFSICRDHRRRGLENGCRWRSLRWDSCSSGARSWR